MESAIAVRGIMLKQQRTVRVARDGSVRFASPFAVPGPSVRYLRKP